MRILHLVNHVHEVGNGITNVTVDLAIEHSRLGHHVTVASAGGSFEPLLQEHGVHVATIDFARRHPAGLIRSVTLLRKLGRQSSPQVVHSHTITPATLVPRFLPGPLSVSTVHNEYQRGVGLMAKSDAVVGVSRAVSHSLVSRGFDGGAVRTVLNGPIGSFRRPPRTSEAESAARPPTFVAVGAISYRKGSDVLVEAFEAVARRDDTVELVFVGADHFPGLRSRVESSPIGHRVRFVGFDPTPERYMSSATALILPSRREPFGLVAVEAQALGTPVIGSDIEGIPEALDYGAGGLLVPAGDSVALADAMTRLLEDFSLRSRLSDGAAVNASRRTTRAMAERYIEIYRERINA